MKTRRKAFHSVLQVDAADGIRPPPEETNRRPERDSFRLFVAPIFCRP
jgi:hypothetical protein